MSEQVSFWDVCPVLCVRTYIHRRKALMKRLNVELGDEDYRYLKERARREGRTLVAILREAVDRMRRADRPEARSDPMYEVGSFEGPADLAERHDGYLYGAE